MTSDTVEDGYADHQLNTGVEGTEEFPKINEGDIGHSIVWIFERDSDDPWLRMGAATTALERNVISFLWGLQTTSEAEARKSMQCLLCGTHQLIAKLTQSTTKEGSVSQ